MRSPEQLRAEVRRLHLKMRNTADPEQRRSLADRALELAQHAEAIASFPNEAEGLCVKLAHYRAMLGRTDDEPTQRVVAELLRDVEDKLEQIGRQQRPLRPHRLAVA
jgi:hypothetical protein